jgi:hypothetical protein
MWNAIEAAIRLQKVQIKLEIPSLAIFSHRLEGCNLPKGALWSHSLNIDKPFKPFLSFVDAKYSLERA